MRDANKNNKAPQFVRRIEMVQKRSIMYYQQQQSQPFLKIVVALPTMVASCRGRVLKFFYFFLYYSFIVVGHIISVTTEFILAYSLIEISGLLNVLTLSYM